MYHNVHYPVATLSEGNYKAPGVCSVRYFKIEDVLTWPEADPQTGILASAIALKPGKLMYLLGSINPSRVYSETPKDGSAGPYFDMIIKGSLMGSTAAHPLTIGTMLHHQWALIVTDKNGVTRLIGNQDSGADLIPSYSSGQGADSRRTELTFQWQHPQPAPIYSATEFDIIIGGLSISAGCIQFIQRFEVGATASPMADGDTLYVNASIANKKVLVIADRQALPCDDGSGDIDWTGSIDRHIEKTLASNTIAFVGGVVNEEKIEIYAIS